MLAERRQATALRPGTISNHRSILSKFVRFCARCNIHFTCPTDQAICMFFEQCLETVKSAATIKNYTSALASCYKQMGLDPSQFEAYRVKNAIFSIDKNVRHVPSQAPPVTPALLRKVIRVTNRLPNGPSISAAFIIMYHTFFRQSNIAAQSTVEFDYTRQLTRGDVTVYPDHVTVQHKWSKSHQRGAHRASVDIPAIPGSLLCPREAVITMIRAVPTRHPLQAFLTFKDGNHIPIPYLRKTWNAVLNAIALPNADSYTLHGLRRGAATHVINTDPTARPDIIQHGMWRSRAVDSYLPKPKSKVLNLLRDTL